MNPLANELSEPNIKKATVKPPETPVNFLPSQSIPWFLVAWTIIFLPFIIIASLLLKRWRTKRKLEGGNCNIPTVLWRPRFINYALYEDVDNDDDCEAGPNAPRKEQKKKKKMASSSITGILPRMERLNGPYGMYGTVYGISTMVVHVAHPTPARQILMETTTGVVTRSSSDVYKKQQQGVRRRRSTVISSSCGTTKSPAYNHFKNFSGDGVFTADGEVWKEKRASVVHCLLRGCASSNSVESQRLEAEANRAADSFIGEIERMRRQSQSDGTKSVSKKVHDAEPIAMARSAEPSVSVNIVPVLQRATIGLIYRYITHDSIGMYGENERKHDDNQCIILRSQSRDENSREDDGDDRSCGENSEHTSSTSVASIVDGEHVPHDSSSLDDLPKPKVNTPIDNSNKRYDRPSPSLLKSYLKSVTEIRMIILAQSRSIWFLLPRWVYETFSPMFREEERTMGPIREFASRACFNAKPGSPLDQLKSRASHGATATNGREKKKKDDHRASGTNDISKEMLDEAITLLFAGQDTSAATLSWTLHLLSLYPDVQSRLAGEVRRVVDDFQQEVNEKPGNGTVDRTNENVRLNGMSSVFGPTVTKKMISKMPYLDAVLKESMRLYPVAPFVVRRLPYDLPIRPDDDHHSDLGPIILPEGSFACIWIYGLHRNKKLWNRPDDFVPERWIDPKLREGDDGQKMSGSYMPFAAGPRNCVGQPLAHVILRVLLARIISAYKVVDDRLTDSYGSDGKRKEKAVDPTALRKDMQAGFTVLPSGGVRLSLKKR